MLLVYLKALNKNKLFRKVYGSIKSMKGVIFLLFFLNLLFASPALALVKANILLVAPKNKMVPIMVYHSVVSLDGHENAMQKHYKVDPVVFESEMKFLKNNGYTTITFSKLAEHIATGAVIPDKSVVITFDDGIQNQYENAFPILKKYGDVATFFVYTKVIHPVNKNFMSWAEVLDLDKAGMEIGSHSISHAMLTTLSAVKLTEEVSGSKKILEERLGKKVNTLAYPSYMQNDQTRIAVQQAGYFAARAGWKKAQNSKSEIYDLGSIEATNNLKAFEANFK